jgi:hypothetical protein
MWKWSVASDYKKNKIAQNPNPRWTYEGICDMEMVNNTGCKKKKIAQNPNLRW